jgi:gamma-glutamyltranspeptidase
MDAAIAALFCNGVVNCQSMGLGGGFLMTVYQRDTKQAFTLNAREAAPAGVSEETYGTDKQLTKEGMKIPQIAIYVVQKFIFRRLYLGKIILNISNI